MDSRAREVVRIGDSLFDKKRPVDALRQELALNFYPERADFTTKRNEGDEFADHLFASYAPLARRELGNMLGEFLRPSKFFSIHVDDDELDEADAERAFLERLTDIQWRVMSMPRANLVGACTLTDHDFATFGDGVLKFDRNSAGDAMLFRNYHPRDVAWSENADGRIDHLHRDWEPTARQLKYHFPKTVSQEVIRACEKDPEKTFRCRHVIMPSRMYDHKGAGGKEYPFVSFYVEKESETVLEKTGLNYFNYVVPRWQTVSGSAYGVSMATSVILPDGRTLQVVMRTLREAGENYVNPPLIAVTEAIRGDIALYPGGITTADIEYDGRIGDVLRPIGKDKSGFPIGVELAAALKEDIRAGMMLDKIQLPEANRAMTATEVRRRIQEHIRAAAPISKPIQKEYNDPLCDGVFQFLREAGAFPMQEMPPSLAGKDIKFRFRSPMDELAEQNEAEVYMDVRDRLLAPMLQIDPSLAEIADWEVSTRDAMRAAGWKQKWFKPKEAVQERRVQMAERAKQQQAMADIASSGQVAEQAGRGGKALAEAQSAAKEANGSGPPMTRR